MYCSERNESVIRQIFQRVVNLFDFEILRDPIFLNIMFGMSIAIFAEINFSMLTPSFLDERKMKKKEIANTMSIIAMVDLVSRGMAPYLGEWLRQPPRVMYMLSLSLLIISRLCNVSNFFQYRILTEKNNKITKSKSD